MTSIMKNKKIYIIAEEAMDWYTIKHICGSEKTARKRFKDLKIEMLQRQLEMIMFAITEYINDAHLFKNKKEQDDVLKINLKMSEEAIKVLTRCTFEHRIRVMIDQPSCTVYYLEP